MKETFASWAVLCRNVHCGAMYCASDQQVVNSNVQIFNHSNLNLNVISPAFNFSIRNCSTENHKTSIHRKCWTAQQYHPTVYTNYSTGENTYHTKSQYIICAV